MSSILWLTFTITLLFKFRFAGTEPCWLITLTFFSLERGRDELCRAKQFRRCFPQYARTYMPACQRCHLRLNAPCPGAHVVHQDSLDVPHQSSTGDLHARRCLVSPTLETTSPARHRFSTSVFFREMPNSHSCDEFSERLQIDLFTSWRQWLLRVVAATAGAWWIDGRGRSTYVLAFFVYSRHWLTEERFDFPRRVQLLTVPGGFYWTVPRDSWCSFPLVFLHREQWSELRLCSVTTESQAEWILYLCLTVSQCSSREVVSDVVALILHFIQPLGCTRHWVLSMCSRFWNHRHATRVKHRIPSETLMGHFYSKGSASVACFVFSGDLPALSPTFHADTILCTQARSS